MPTNPSIVFMGTPPFAAGILSYLLDHGVIVKGVVTTPDKASGRGLEMQQSAVKKCALLHEIPLLQPISLKDPSFLEALAAWDASLFVVVAFRMLPTQVWQMPALGTFNLHASLLPQYRGAAPINRAIMDNQTVTGITTFLLDQQIDTGKILLQKEISILPDDNAGTLHDKLLLAGGPLVLDTLHGLGDGSLSGRIQTLEAGQTLLPAPKIFKEDCRIQWNKTANQIVCQIRGLSPSPTAFATLLHNGKREDIKIFAAKAIPSAHSAALGTLESDGKKFLRVACADGWVQLDEIQAPGKKRILIQAFLAGFRNPREAFFE